MNLDLSIHGSPELHVAVLRAIIGPRIHRLSCIDLCCNEATTTSLLPFLTKTYVDVVACPLKDHGHQFVQANVLSDHSIFSERYDVALCLDGIEHLSKDDGFRLLKRMESISNRQVVFTPLGELWVTPDNPDPAAHKSGWVPGDFSGYATITCRNFHHTVGAGAFWAWKCDKIDEDFRRVCDELKRGKWL